MRIPIATEAKRNNVTIPSSTSCTVGVENSSSSCCE